MSTPPQAFHSSEPRKPGFNTLSFPAPASRSAQQYVETSPNPPPEFVATGPEYFTESSQITGANSSPPPSHQHQTPTTATVPNPHDSYLPEIDTTAKAANCTTSPTAMRQHVWDDPPKMPWYRRISSVGWLIITITFLGISGVVLAILGAMGFFTGHHRSGDSSSLSDYTTIISVSSLTSAQAEVTNPAASGAGDSSDMEGDAQMTATSMMISTTASQSSSISRVALNPN